jgi:negative regulator of sigma E activity
MSDREDREALEAYHDGELGGFARWRLERRLRRDPGLRRELAQLAALGDALREAAVQAPGPDLWDGIERGLRAEDARRDEAESEQARRGFGRRGWLVGAPLGAAVAASLVLAVGLGERRAPPKVGVVRWVDAGKRNVMVLQDDADEDATIIWVLDAPPSETGGDGGSGGVA